MLWLACAVGGLFVVWAYENGPGTPATVESEWPANTSLERAADRPTLVLLAHPQCTCTRATLGELAEALARAESLPKTYVVFLKPSSMPDGWEKTDLWKTAAALPNATVVRDDDGREAERFGAATSGQTMLYDARGIAALQRRHHWRARARRRQRRTRLHRRAAQSSTRCSRVHQRVRMLALRIRQVIGLSC